MIKKFIFIILIILFAGGFVAYKISGGEKTQTPQPYMEVDKYSINLVDNPNGVITAQDKFRKNYAKNFMNDEKM